MARSEPTFSVKDPAAFMPKFGLPAMLVLGSLLVFMSAEQPGGFVLGAILAALAVLQFYICGLAQAVPECVLYKRFRRWERIEYEEIVGCGASVFPLGLYYLKLRRFVPPFGKLYFVFCAPKASPWEELRHGREFLDYIRVRMGKPAGSVADQPRPATQRQRDGSTMSRIKQCAISAGLAGGFIFFYRVFLGWPGPGFPPPIEPGQPWYWQANLYWWHFCHRILDWPYNLIAIAVLLGSIVALRFSRAAASLAIALGAIVGGLLARVFVA